MKREQSIDFQLSVYILYHQISSFDQRPEKTWVFRHLQLPSGQRARIEPCGLGLEGMESRQPH